METLLPYIDWSPFFMTWEMKGKYPRIFDDPAVGKHARELFDDAQQLLNRIVRERLLHAHAVYGFWPAASDGDDIVVLNTGLCQAETYRWDGAKARWTGAISYGGGEAHGVHVVDAGHCTGPFDYVVGHAVLSLPARDKIRANQMPARRIAGNIDAVRIAAVARDVFIGPGDRAAHRMADQRETVKVERVGQHLGRAFRVDIGGDALPIQHALVGSLYFPSLVLATQATNNFVEHSFTVYTGPKEYHLLARLGAHWSSMVAVARAYRAALDGALAPAALGTELTRLIAPFEACNGYYHDQPGAVRRPAAD